MSEFGEWLAEQGWEVDDTPVYGRPESVTWTGVQWIMLHHYAGSEDAARARWEAEYAKTAAGRYPPLCHLYQDVTGKVWVIAKERPGQPIPGRASHAGMGSYPGIPTNGANEVALGIEIQESGDTPVSAHPDRYQNMLRLAADSLDFFGLPTSRLIDHEEYAGHVQGKIDLRDDMDVVRRDVAKVRQARREVLRAQVFGDVIDADDDYLTVWEALPNKGKPSPKIIVLGDLVHRNSPAAWWTNKWGPTYGSLRVCKVWSVLGNHGWGWSGGGRFKAARGRTYWEWRRGFHEACTMDVGKRPKFCWVKLRPGWLILGLDSEHPFQSRLFLNRMVKRYPKRKVLVLIHRPPILPPGSSAPRFRGPALKRRIGQTATLVMSGHSHRFWRTTKNGVEYVVAGTGEDKGWAHLRLYGDGTYKVVFERLSQP